MTHLFAYLDPGSASMAFQAVVAGVAAAVFFLRHKIAQGARALKRLVPGSTNEDPSSDNDAN